MADDNTPVSAKISAFKSLEIIIQALMAYGVSYFAVLLAQKTGLKLDAAVQAQVVVLAMMVVTALIHGTYNYLTHSAWGKKFDIFARYIS